MRHLLLIAFSLTLSMNAQSYEGKASKWHDFDRYDFVVGKQKAILVVPDTPAKGLPWVWRARFFGHEPQADIALLAKGYHIAYCDVPGLFGNAEAEAHWDTFYAHVVGKYNLARKVALEGMSRGGLIIYNWAASNPDKVACLYGDAPVCDVRSWPGGKGTGKGSPGDWERAKESHGFTEEEAEAFKGNPIDRLEPLAKGGIPILHVVGDADKVVPISENSDVIEQRYQALGGQITVIHKPGVGHHPHALEDPKRIVDFIHKHTSAALAEKETSARVHVRSGLGQSWAKFREDKVGHVAFMGGSITEMNGYRPMVCDLLKTRFPETEFTFTDAGISSTCSTTGSFRLEDDVLSKGKVDLFFVEFAVNDDQDAEHAARDCVRGLEGIVRQALKSNPEMDVVVTYFVNPSMLEALQAGEDPISIASHERVTKHYQIPAIHLAGEVADRVTSQRITWEQFGGTHPAPYGNRLCADLIDLLFDASEGVTPSARKVPMALDAGSYEHGRFLDMTSYELEVPSWKELRGNCRTRFREVPMLSLNEKSEPLEVVFEGASFGAYILAGPDAGVVEVSIDGGEWTPHRLYHRHSKGLHYPRTVILANELERGPHKVKLRVRQDPEHEGAAMRVLHFVAN